MPPAAAVPNWLVAMLLGLVEGLTEFLPVSSTGHLLLAERILPRQSDAFNIVVQMGAVLAVVAAFRHRLQAIVQGYREPENMRLISQLTLAFGLTGVGGLWLKRAGLKLPETTAPVAWATLIGGVLFLVVEFMLARRPKGAAPGAVGWAGALAMAAGQLVAAALPGASRSGTTILFALGLGASRPAATEFSFLLGVPTILAAGLVELYGLSRHGQFSEPLLPLLAGEVVAFATALLVVHWLLRFVRSHTFVVFGIYRLLLGGALLLLG